MAKSTLVGFIGRNRSGKTLLFKAISGIINATEGTVKVNNKVIGKDINFPENIGLIIESLGFIPNMSGYKNLEILAQIKNKISKEKIKDSIKLVGLNPDDKKAVKKYSLGMRQRLGIAQAIMKDPEILLLDEPMNGLDKNGVSDIRKYILQIRENGITILIASHNSEDTDTLCDTVFEMDGGIISKIR